MRRSNRAFLSPQPLYQLSSLYYRVTFSNKSLHSA
jgi:hypothetical protein